MGTEILQEEYKDLLAKNDQYRQLIKQHKEHLSSLDKKMRETRSSIWEKHAASGGWLKQQEKCRYQLKHTSILEHKLCQDTTNFDKLLTRNKAVRDNIDHLLQQRDILYKSHKKLKLQLARQNNDMEKLVEKSILSYKQRSGALSRMLEVRECSKVETEQFHMKMLKLKTDISSEVKLQNFMEKKTRGIEDEETKKRKGKIAQKDQMGDKKLETYKMVHHTLLEVTGESDLLQIAKKFIDSEENHFAHFNYINELHKRNNMLNIRINKVKNDILLFELQNKAHDDQYKSQLKDLEVKLEEYHSRANSLESQCTLVQKTHDQLKTAIADLFANINPGLITEKLGCSAHVTHDNIREFTSIMEESINEQLMLLVFANIKEADQMEVPPQNLLLASYDLLPAVVPSNVEAPSATDWQKDETMLASEQPLSYLNLCERMLPRVVQRESGTWSSAH